MPALKIDQRPWSTQKPLFDRARKCLGCLASGVDKKSACHQNAETGRLEFQAQLLRGYLNSNALSERIFLLVTLLPRSWSSLH